jgi:predicted phosphodiesterase
MSKILILGDVHGEWGDLNIVIAKALRLHPDIERMIQVGDFGYAWPGSKPFKFLKTFWENNDLEKVKALPFHWLDGNHENHNQLELDGGASQPGMIYQPRGSVVDFGYPYGRTMFFGGASSIDKDSRVQDKSWWPQESIRYGQVLAALEQEGPLDMVISHECPLAFPYGNYKKEFGRADKQALDAIREKFRPKFWVFGHHHTFQGGLTDGTLWACAPCIDHKQALLWDGDSITMIDCSKRQHGLD